MRAGEQKPCHLKVPAKNKKIKVPAIRLNWNNSWKYEGIYITLSWKNKWKYEEKSQHPQNH